MRRKEKEIAVHEELRNILRKAEYCTLSFPNGAFPCLIPISCGYDDGFLYFHGASEGEKMRFVYDGAPVSFSVVMDQRLIRYEDPARWTMRYRSVIGRGRIEILETAGEKSRGLDILLRHYGGEPPEQYQPAMLSKMLVFRIRILSLTGKRSPVS